MRRALPIVLTALLVCAPAAAADKLRIGITAMPAEHGNPFGTAGTTANFILPAVYDRLFAFDNDGKLQPQLAARWEMRDPKTWAVTLRRDIVFSNGERLDAAGVKAVFDALRAPEAVAYFGAREPRQLAAVETENDDTLILRTREPNAVLPGQISIVPMAAPGHLAKVGIAGLAAQPVGSGPFTVESWSEQRIVMRANPTSWRKPQVAELEYLVLPEPMSRMQGLLSDRIDIAIAVDPEQIEDLHAAGKRVVQRKPNRILTIVFNTLDPGSPFRNEKVRQAMNYAVDRAAIARQLLAGLVAPASQGTVPEAHGYNPDLKPYPYDPGKARALLREAGYPNGFAFTFEFPAGTLASGAAIMQQVAADLAKVGVAMKVQPISFAQFTRQFTQGGWGGQALLSDYPVYSLDGLRSFYRSTHSCDWSAPWFCDRNIQPLIDAAGVEIDLTKREAMTRQVLAYYRDTAESLLLFPVLGLDALGPRVGGWETWNDIIQFHKLTATQ